MKNEKLKFRASSLSKLLTSPRSKNEVLSVTAKTYLRELWIENTYGRRKEITSKFMEKGTLVEEKSLTLLTEVTGQFYKKNETQFENDFITGTPDIFPGLLDIKSCWDLWTFMEFDVEDYSEQMQAYMWLTGEEKCIVAACLVDTPEHLINDAKRSYIWKNGIIDPDIEPAFSQLEKIETNMTFSDIPEKDRVKIYEFQFDENFPKIISERYVLWLDYYNNLKLV